MGDGRSLRIQKGSARSAAANPSVESPCPVPLEETGAPVCDSASSASEKDRDDSNAGTYISAGAAPPPDSTQITGANRAQLRMSWIWSFERHAMNRLDRPDSEEKMWASCHSWPVNRCCQTLAGRGLARVQLP